MFLTLASVTPGNGRRAGEEVDLGLGVPRGTGCAVTTEVGSTPISGRRFASGAGGRALRGGGRCGTLTG